MKIASPKKLRDGNWGAVVETETKERFAVDDEIMIVTRSGRSWISTIAEVIWTGKGYNGGFATIMRTA